MAEEAVIRERPPAEGAVAAPMPRVLKPMLATLAEKPFSDPGWLFEVKWDGIRGLTFYDAGEIHMYSRRLDITGQYPELVPALREALQGHDQVILDGEVVAFEEGRPSFERLQQRMNVADKARIKGFGATIPVAYVVFDILYLDGYSLLKVELDERRRVLEATVRAGEKIQVPPAYPQQGEQLYAAAARQQLEGIIAKDRRSRYEDGRRSTNWLKFKVTKTVDAVVGGYTEPRASRKNFGALLLGLYDGKDLVYVAHTGSGFDQGQLDTVYKQLRELERKTSPFSTVPQTNSKPHWVEPHLVAEVKYANVTEGRHLRLPVFVGLRPDKAAEQCTFESQIPEAAPPAPKRPAAEASVARAEAKQAQAPAAAKKTAPRLLKKEEKIFWPTRAGRPAVTKGMLAEYYVSMQEHILPFTRGRPVSMLRHPDGIYGPSFWHKDYTQPIPEGIPTYTHYSEGDDRDMRYIVGENADTLVWLAQLGCLEINTWMSRTDRPNYPDFIVFDVDPYLSWQKGQKDTMYTDQDYVAAQDAAGWLKELLDQLGLRAYLKTSGKTGLHVYVPIKRDYTYDQTRDYARTLVEHLARRHPKELTTEWREVDRAGKVFLDFTINTRAKTLCIPYSPRPVPLATVSAPLAWDELFRVNPAEFTIFNIKDRIAKVGDLWKDIFDDGQELRPSRG